MGTNYKELQRMSEEKELFNTITEKKLQYLSHVLRETIFQLLNEVLGERSVEGPEFIAQQLQRMT